MTAIGCERETKTPGKVLLFRALLLCMCPHATIYVSYYICVGILLYMCPHTTTYVCVLILLYIYVLILFVLIAPCVPVSLTAIASSKAAALRAYHGARRMYICPHTAMCVLMLLSVCVGDIGARSRSQLYMCPHTTTYVSSYYYRCVLILLQYMCPRTTIDLCAGDIRARVALSACQRARNLYICVLSSYYYMCPHTTIFFFF